MRAGHVAEQPVTWCWTLACSRPATTSRGARTRARTRYTRCRCGFVHRAAWPSCWQIPPSPRNRGAPSRPRSSPRPRTRWPGSRQAGLLPGDGVVLEYGSPHGGSWLDLLAARGLVPSARGGQADVIVDCFGMMHAADQRAALAERAERLAPGGVLLLQYHALSTILAGGQWNALRHGHYAYYSTTALTAMLAAGPLARSHGLAVRPLWRHRAAGRDPRWRPAGPAGRRSWSRCWPKTSTSASGIPARSPASSGRCGYTPRRYTTGWRRSGPPGRRSSATGPHPGRWHCCARRTLITPSCPRSSTPRRPSRACGCPVRTSRWQPRPSLPARSPAAVLLFVPDLLAEVRSAYPEVEQAGGWWVDAETLGSRSLQQDA